MVVWWLGGEQQDSGSNLKNSKEIAPIPSLAPWQLLEFA
jgi:hypothetical protein